MPRVYSINYKSGSAKRTGLYSLHSLSKPIAANSERLSHPFDGPSRKDKMCRSPEALAFWSRRSGLMDRSLSLLSVGESVETECHDRAAVVIEPVSANSLRKTGVFEV